MDPKTLIAILILGVAWMGWQSYMTQKYPDYYTSKPAEEKPAENAAPETMAGVEKSGASETASAETAEAQTIKNGEVADPKIMEETTLSYSDQNVSFELSSKGMGFNKLVLNNYTNRDGEKFTFTKVGNQRPMETSVVGVKSKLDFAIEKVGDKRFVGTAFFGGVKITKAIEIQSEDFLFNTDISVNGDDERFLGLQVSVVKEMQDIETSTFMPTFERQEFFVVNDGSDERLLLSKEEAIKESFPKVGVASVGTQYFSQSLVDRSEVIPEFRAESDQTRALGTLIYSALNKKSDFKLSYQAYVGPKDLDILEKIDGQLANVIDFGMFSWLAKPMLHLMKWFHGMVGNWGLAIIILTLLVRMIVLPFTVMSYKSLAKMKDIQPQIKALKEKYKDDNQKLNQEMMLLMKTNKVNPLGGCLPMLLQFPVFIALYQVLGQSIELYQAPFYFWIEDLSLKDPYYVLPVLMAVTMFIQQKITPNTMDPAQAKMMMFLPVVFALFMLSLPSGLTLYIFVSALFAILQQMFFMRDTNNQAVATA